MRLIIAMIIVAMSAAASGSDYPISREEKIREEVGSVVGSDGVTFRPFHTKNEETKTKSNKNANINEYLWDATLDVLKSMPIATQDSKKGLIITDWYTTEKEPNYSLKIQVTISDDVISPEALKVSVFERKMKKGEWYNEPVSEATSRKYEEETLRKAREIYIEKSHSYKYNKKTLKTRNNQDWASKYEKNETINDHYSSKNGFENKVTERAVRGFVSTPIINPLMLQINLL